jgi:Cdc6-like AAA superfamily ATPase
MMEDSNQITRSLTLLERRESNVAMNNEFLKSLFSPVQGLQAEQASTPGDLDQLKSSSFISNQKLSAAFEEFIVRKSELSKIIEFLSSSVLCQPMIVYGEHGQGKTSVCQAALSVLLNTVVVHVDCGMFDNRRDVIANICAHLMDIVKKHPHAQSFGETTSPKAYIDVHDLVKYIASTFQALPSDQIIVLFFDDIDRLEAIQRALIAKVFILSSVNFFFILHSLCNYVTCHIYFFS